MADAEAVVRVPPWPCAALHAQPAFATRSVVGAHRGPIPTVEGGAAALVLVAARRVRAVDARLGGDLVHKNGGAVACDAAQRHERVVAALVRLVAIDKREVAPEWPLGGHLWDGELGVAKGHAWEARGTVRLAQDLIGCAGPRQVAKVEGQHSRVRDGLEEQQRAETGVEADFADGGPGRALAKSTGVGVNKVDLGVLVVEEIAPGWVVRDAVSAPKNAKQSVHVVFGHIAVVDEQLAKGACLDLNVGERRTSVHGVFHMF